MDTKNKIMLNQKIKTEKNTNTLNYSKINNANLHGSYTNSNYVRE